VISQKAKYALRALVMLCRTHGSGTPQMISEISRSQGIPKKFLEQILLELKRHGVVVSRRGRQGGYVLLQRPETVTFGEILRLIDGPIAPLPCLSRIAYRRCADCADEDTCEIRQVFHRVAEATREVLDRTTLADAANGKRTLP
jgi:Rrf2 family protein